MANFIPPELIEEINQRTDILELVSQYVVLKKQGRNFVGLCPFHNEDTASFSVSPDKQIFYCFGCNKGGNAINFLMSIEGLSFPEAVEKLANKVGIEIPKQKLSASERARLELKQALYSIHTISSDFFQEALYGSAGKKALLYLNKRGVNKELAKKFCLGYALDSWDALLNHLLQKGFSHQQIEMAGLSGRTDKGSETRFYDKFRDRIIFPIHDYRGQVIAFGGRIMGDGQPKYLNSPETPIFHKSNNLYGIYVAGTEIRNADEAVLMEGYMDVIAAHQYGVSNAVASLGTAFTIEHGRLLKRYTTKVILAYDGDNAGINATLKGLEILNEQGFMVRILPFPSGQDPDDFLRSKGKEGWDELIRNKALGLLEYKMEHTLSKYDILTVSGKGSAVQELLPDIIRCKNQVERDTFINLLAKRLGTNANAIYADLNKKGLRKPIEYVKNTIPKAKARPVIIYKNLEITERNRIELLLCMLSNKEIFNKVEKEIGFNFLERQSLQELLLLVQKIKQEYNWQPASLFSYLEEGETKQMLLIMLNLNIESCVMPALSEGYIQALKIEKAQKELNELENRLTDAKTGETSKEILSKIAILQQTIRKLRQK